MTKKCFIYLFLACITTLLFFACTNDTSYLIELGEYTGIEYEYTNPVVDEEALKEDIALSYRITKAVKHTVTDRTCIEENDFINVSYDTYVDSEKYGSNNQDSFKVGANIYLPELEKQMIGKEVGEAYSIDVTMPEEYSVSELAGKTVTFEIVATSIYYYDIPEMTDEYFQEKGYASYEEYYNAVYASKLYELNYYERESVCDGILFEIISNSTFHISDLDIESNYDRVLDKYMDLASIYELTLEDYVCSVLGFKDMEVFYEMCKDEAEYQIKDELIREELLSIADIDLTDEEIIDIAIKELQYPRDSIFDMKDQLKGLVQTHLLYDFLLKNSIRVELDGNVVP